MVWSYIVEIRKKSQIFCGRLSEKNQSPFVANWGVFQHILPLFMKKTPFFTILTLKGQHEYHFCAKFQFFLNWIYRLVKNINLHTNNT